MKNKLLLAVIIATVTSSTLLLAQATRSSEAQFKAAQHEEEVVGDLKGAIELYRTIAQSGDRALAARALVRMAGCHQKLGNAEARTIYERVIRDFGDQKDAVAMARARLGGANSGARATGDRVVKAGADITWGDGRVSPDGRFISYTDWNLTGNLILHDLVVGTDRPLTGNKDWSVGNAYSSTFSRDGRQVAYGWRTYSQPAFTNELRIMSVEGAGIPQPRRVYASDEIDFFNPTDWSPDDKSLAVLVTRKDQSGLIAIIGVQDGSFRGLKTVGWRGPKKMFFSPDGRYLAYDLPANDAEAQRDVFIIAVDGSSETPAVQHPGDDVVMGWSLDGSRLLFASDRTNAVALWTQPVTDGKPRGAPALLKPDIGSVLSQGLTASGTLHIVRDASTLSLQVAPIDLEAGRLLGPAVLENFRSGRPDWSADGKQLAYKSTTANGLQAVSIRSVESGRVRELRPALLYINEPRWLPDSRSLVVFGRDFKGHGAIYRIDAETGKASVIADADLCRVQVSPDGKKIYYEVGRVTLGSGPQRLFEHHLSSGDTRELFTRPDGGGNVELSPDGRFLALVVVDPKTKTTTLTVRPVAGGEPRALFHVNHPDRLEGYGGMSWTPDSQAVIVVNATGDRFEPKDLWLVPVTGGKARKLDIDIRGWKALGIRLQPDGKQIAFFTGQDLREVWALENVLQATLAR
ncbi:MAG: hypothetical protein LC753_10880 [Acidobacteria bacterium]|nr:hypothetical protein [Acidobacteriota bacterium]